MEATCRLACLTKAAEMNALARDAKCVARFLRKVERRRGCAIHHPSGHHMRDWPTFWRDDRMVLERVCPHGVGHMDPDDAAYRATRGDTDTTHGCDGCCRPS